MTKKVSLSLTVQEWGVVSSVLSNAGRPIDAKGVSSTIERDRRFCSWIADELARFADLIALRVQKGGD